MTTSKQKIRIVTDSVADIDAATLEKWNIAVIPTYVNFDGNSYADDGHELDRAAFYRNLPSMSEYPTTAAPAPGVAEEVLNNAIEGYDHLVCIHIPEKLSATINNVRLAAASLKDRVTVIDSGTLTMGIGYQAIIAAEIAAETGDVKQVADAVERVRVNQKLYALIADINYLRRSGRVSAVVAFAGSLLQVKPILDVHDGVVDVAQRVRTLGKAIDRLKEMTEAQAPLERLCVLHIDNESGAKELVNMLGDVVPSDLITIVAGPTLGTHIGPGALGVVTLKKNWRS